MWTHKYQNSISELLTSLFSLLKYSIPGAFFGSLCAIMVSLSLVEISLSAFFSSCFGCCFLALGLLLLCKSRLDDNDETSNDPRPGRDLSITVLLFGLLNLGSGISCFLVEDKWFLSRAYWFKVPMYMAMSASLTFALVFTFLDFVNSGVCNSLCCAACLVRAHRWSRVEMYIIVSITLLSGVVFGFSFGSLDVEDDDNARGRLYQTLLITAPMGAVSGTLISLVVRRARFISESGQIYNYARVAIDENEFI